MARRAVASQKHTWYYGYMELPRTAGNFAVWVLGALLVSAVARIGWELGGRVWSLF